MIDVATKNTTMITVMKRHRNLKLLQYGLGIINHSSVVVILDHHGKNFLMDLMEHFHHKMFYLKE